MELTTVIPITILCIWVFIALLNRPARYDLGERIRGTILAPLALAKGSDSDSDYARNLLVDLNKLLIGAIKGLSDGIRSLYYWGENQIAGISNKKPLKAFFYGMNTVLLVALLYSDTIAISTSLATVIPTLEVPEFFWNYVTAVAFGSFFSIIIGGLIINDIVQEKSEFSDWGEQGNITAKSLPLLMSIFLIISGFIAVVGLGLARLNVLLPSLSEQTKNAIEQITSGTINVLVPVNVAIATYLVFSAGIKGIAVLLGVLAILVNWLTTVLVFIFQIMISTMIFILDIVSRIITSVASILFFFILTPIDMIGRLFIR
jgi:hypothetical protein